LEVNASPTIASNVKMGIVDGSLIGVPMERNQFLPNSVHLTIQRVVVLKCYGFESAVFFVYANPEHLADV
jgi:hypothetical protein